jgi:hypothetical protein
VSDKKISLDGDSTRETDGNRGRLSFVLLQSTDPTRAQIDWIAAVGRICVLPQDAGREAMLKATNQTACIDNLWRTTA